MRLGAVVPMLTVALFAWQPAAQAAAKLDTEVKKFSYAQGADLGKEILNTKFTFDHEQLVEGLKDSLAGGKMRMTQEEMDAVRSSVIRKKREQAIAKVKKMAGENQQLAEDFLSKNSRAKGVRSTPSGLQYKVLTQGTGKKPTLENKVKVHYEGKLLNGKVFDSSYKRGEPVSFGLDQVIPGWTEGVQLMNVGSTYQLFIPPQLAYGKRGRPPVIPPQSLLVFKVELLSVE
uniref:Peptidyl-prolyl cis-trans isomerase n=1 Tax=Magnetococcus massalia (strain MO-1) TaxID=451514 RepID=A0A1S7LFX4_MAGMO|nr:Peptidyl-prolyl cis-trans isomerase Mip [Candidatus Magnetococcus massalia]